MMSLFRFPTILKVLAFCTVLSLASCSRGAPVQDTETPVEAGGIPAVETVR